MSTEIERYYSVERAMADQDIILAFRDTLTEGMIEWLLTIIELKVAIHSHNKKLRSRVFLIVVECLQNILNHALKDDESSLLLVGKNPEGMFIKTGNTIDARETEAFEKRITAVNSKALEEVRGAYRDHLATTGLSEKGGAGLGLMDIYKRSGNPIKYEIKPIDSERAFLTMEVVISVV